MKTWRCTVCGHIHKGDAPPLKCPVCGASSEKFELMPEEGAQNAARKDEEKLTEGKRYEADVLVVGSGAAALAAAATARQQGASVILLEKATELGGTTARSGGGYWIPGNRFQREYGIHDDKEDCLRYMARYSYPQLYQPQAARYGLPEHEYALLNAYYDNAHKMVDYLGDIGALHSVMEINWTGKPQVDYVDHLPENKGIRGRSLYPVDDEGKQSFGGELIRQLAGWAKAHDVDIHTGAEVTALLRDSTGRVTGLRAIEKNAVDTYAARKGVIFGSGGYSHSQDLMLHFQRGPHFGGCAVPTNTGDFIRMAGSLGAQLGNMAGAFRAQSMLEAALENPAGSSNVFYIAGDSVLIVNKYGERVMDEKRNYTDRAMLHFVWDPQRAEWQNMLMFMVFDQRTAALWQGFPPFPVQGQEASYLLKAETMDALAEKIEKRLQALKDHTGGFGLAPGFAASLKDTVQRFNTFAIQGKDEDFHRGEYAYDREWTTFPPTVPDAKWPKDNAENYTMYPLSGEGPYYAIILAAGTLDTNGGPVVDAHARVLDWAGNPIPGLYGAGNCIASPTANAYWGAGSTIGPAMTFGYLAALDATKA